VVIASDPIHHPHLIKPTNGIIMSQEAYAKYAPKLAVDATLLIDDGLVTLPEEHRQDLKTYGIPATQIAEELGNSRAANTVMLGLWTAIIGAVSKAAMQQSVTDAVPPKTVEVNLNAFEAGYQKGLHDQGSSAL
jgi:2-oxoglutarate ferredoxin oxidoreductase subunit gamma